MCGAGTSGAMEPRHNEARKRTLTNGPNCTSFGLPFSEFCVCTGETHFYCVKATAVLTFLSYATEL